MKDKNSAVLPTSHCQNCIINQSCLPRSLNLQELSQFNKIIKRDKPVQKGEFLFKSKTTFTSLYAIRSGMVKNYSNIAQGEQIHGFYSTGDLVGLDGMGSSQYVSSAQVLDTSMICEIPFMHLEPLLDKIPALRNQLLRLMSNQIRQKQAHIFALCKKNAQQRLSFFIYSLMKKLAQRGFMSEVFRLSMSRSDIGNYLGLTVETISRLFTQLQAEHVLTIDGKYVTVKNKDRLRMMSNPNALQYTFSSVDH